VRGATSDVFLIVPAEFPGLELWALPEPNEPPFLFPEASISNPSPALPKSLSANSSPIISGAHLPGLFDGIFEMIDTVLALLTISSLLPVTSEEFYTSIYSSFFAEECTRYPNLRKGLFGSGRLT
jgi:hypothetical protein